MDKLEQVGRLTDLTQPNVMYTHTQCILYNKFNPLFGEFIKMLIYVGIYQYPYNIYSWNWYICLYMYEYL